MMLENIEQGIIKLVKKKSKKIKADLETPGDQDCVSQNILS